MTKLLSKFVIFCWLPLLLLYVVIIMSSIFYYQYLYLIIAFQSLFSIVLYIPFQPTLHIHYNHRCNLQYSYTRQLAMYLIVSISIMWSIFTLHNSSHTVPPPSVPAIYCRTPQSCVTTSAGYAVQICVRICDCEEY